jgi:hypothetical protein
MEQAESNLDSLRVFTTEKWFVQLGMAVRGIACCSKYGTAGRIAMQMPVRLIIGVDANEAERWRYFTVSVLFEEGRFDSRLYMADNGMRN